MESLPTPTTPLRLAKVSEIPGLPGFGWLTQSALRHLIHNAVERLASNGDIIPGNGLDTAIIRIGRRVLIDLDAFEAWLKAHRCGPRIAHTGGKNDH